MRTGVRRARAPREIGEGVHERSLVVLAVLAVAAAAACAGAPEGAGGVDANQEPVAVLALPASARAQVPASLSAAGSLDVDGALLGARLAFGDGSDDVVLGADPSAPLASPAAVDAAALTVEHTWPSAGLYDVELAVVDDQGLVGRARLRLAVAPPPDAQPPALASFTVSRDHAVLGDGDRVAAGDAIDVAVHAADAEGNLAGVDVVAGDAPLASITLAGADAAGTAAISLSGLAGDVVVGAVARDLFGNASPTTTITLHVISPDDDSDGDGLDDVDDPAPLAWNGLTAAVFTGVDIPHDLLGGDRAEKLVDDVADNAPAATFRAALGYDAVGPSTEPLSSLWPGQPDVSDHFAVRFAGALVAPAGADHVVVDVTADDVGVVFLGGQPVASADGEYATDFFRFEHVPPESDPIALPPDGRIPLSIVVADGDNAYAWSIRFRFLAGADTVMNPEAVGRAQFEVSP